MLSGANAYGDTLVEAGTLIGAAGAISGDITNAGTVVFDQAGDAAFAGAVAGLSGTDGGMIKRSAGTLTLAGDSLLDWSVEAGGLVSASDRFGGDVAIGTDAASVSTRRRTAPMPGFCREPVCSPSRAAVR